MQTHKYDVVIVGAGGAGMRAALESSLASATPAASAGRASGRATSRKVAAALRPSVRLTSSTHTDCARKLARAVM